MAQDFIQFGINLIKNSEAWQSKLDRAIGWVKFGCQKNFILRYLLIDLICIVQISIQAFSSVHYINSTKP